MKNVKTTKDGVKFTVPFPQWECTTAGLAPDAEVELTKEDVVKLADELGIGVYNVKG